MIENFLEIQKEYLRKICLRLYDIFYLPNMEVSASVNCLFAANATSFMPVAGLADVAEYMGRKIIKLVRKEKI
jgi:hypothetical protein